MPLFQLDKASKSEYYPCSKNIFVFQMDMKTVPLNPNEIRALVSANLSDISVESKDFKCSCVCDPPLPPPRVSFRSIFI